MARNRWHTKFAKPRNKSIHPPFIALLLTMIRSAVILSFLSSPVQGFVVMTPTKQCSLAPLQAWPAYKKDDSSVDDLSKFAAEMEDLVSDLEEQDQKSSPFSSFAMSMKSPDGLKIDAGAPLKSLTTKTQMETDGGVNDSLKSLSTKTQAFMESDTVQTLTTKTQAFLEDENVQEISRMAKDFAVDAASQIFGVVGNKLKELKEEKEKARM